MKKLLTLTIILFFYFNKQSSAQILCINCYNQNDSISNNVNNLLVNGGFENTTCSPFYPGYYDVYCPNATNYSCDIMNWTCTGGGSDSYPLIFDSASLNSIIVEGIYSAYFGNDFCKACSNVWDDTSCLSQILCSTIAPPAGFPNHTPSYGGSSGVSLEQTVNGLVVGNTYVLEFWSGGEAHSISSNPGDGLFAIDIGFGKTFLRDPHSPPVVGVGRTYLIQFNAISTSHNIKFTNWGHICYTCTELVLDNVRLYTIAELDASVAHCAVGINEQNENVSLNLFPNPFNDKLKVTVNNYDLTQIDIYDITSRKLLHQEFKNSATLSTTQLAKGIYLYEVRNKNGVIKKGKVVKD